MLEAVTRENAHLYAEEMQQMFMLRHRIFVERLGWEALRKPDGIEKDQFDTDDTIYLLLIEEHVVVGCHRLLPTTKPHLFSEIFHYLCDVKGVLRAENVYELNRTCVDLETLSPDRCRWARQAVMVGLMEFCLQAGIERLSVLTAPHYISHYLKCGWKIVPLGVPHELDGEIQVAVEIHCTQEGITAMREFYQFHSPIIRWQRVGQLQPPTSVSPRIYSQNLT